MRLTRWTFTFKVNIRFCTFPILHLLCSEARLTIPLALVEEENKINIFPVVRRLYTQTLSQFRGKTRYSCQRIQCLLLFMSHGELPGFRHFVHYFVLHACTYICRVGWSITTEFYPRVISPRKLAFSLHWDISKLNSVSNPVEQNQIRA